MITETEYNIALATVKVFEESLGLYNVTGSLPFSEYHDFHKWLKDEGWYEAANMEYDNLNNPNSCIRCSIKELYVEYKQRQ